MCLRARRGRSRERLGYSRIKVELPTRDGVGDVVPGGLRHDVTSARRPAAFGYYGLGGYGGHDAPIVEGE